MRYDDFKDRPGQFSPDFQDGDWCPLDRPWQIACGGPGVQRQAQVLGEKSQWDGPAFEPETLVERMRAYGFRARIASRGKSEKPAQRVVRRALSDYICFTPIRRCHAWLRGLIARKGFRPESTEEFFDGEWGGVRRFFPTGGVTTGDGAREGTLATEFLEASLL